MFIHKANNSSVMIYGTFVCSRTLTFTEGPFKIVIIVASASSPNYYLRVHPKNGKSEESTSEIPPDLGDESYHTKSTSKKQSKQKAKEDLKPLPDSLLVTEDEKEASCFFLVPVEEKEDDEFYVAYYHENLCMKGGRYIPPRSNKSIPYYLHAEPTITGWKSTRGLVFVAHPDQNCKFRFLRSGPISTSSRSSLIKDAQKEPIYIKCPRHWSRSSFLCVFKDEHPSIGCTHSIDMRRYRSYHYLLFNLILVKPSSAESGELDGNSLPDPAASLYHERKGSSQALEPAIILH